MIVLVTGATGLLGQHLVAALRARETSSGRSFYPDGDAASLAARGAGVYRGDVRDRDSLTDPMRGVDGVVHLAAMTGAGDPLHARRRCRFAAAGGVIDTPPSSRARPLMWGSGWVRTTATPPTARTHWIFRHLSG